MMKQATATGMIAAISAVCPTCAPDQPAPERPAQVIYISEDYNFTFDAQGGDTLILIMTPDGGQLDRCNDYGGELNYNPFTRIFTCDDADF